MIAIPMTDEDMRELFDRVQEEARRTGWHWRYLATGKASHALRRTIDAGAVCGIGGWPSEWLGTGSQTEYERAATLPRCRRCIRRTVECESEPK